VLTLCTILEEIEVQKCN